MLRRRRAGERGQTLILSLAFLALFGLFAVTVLRFAGVTEAQRTSTELTASLDALARGAAQFALADTNTRPCGSAHDGSTTVGSSTLSYTVTSCVAGDRAGLSCELCLLHGPSDSLETDKKLTVRSEIDSNGSLDGTIVSTAPNAKISMPTGLGCGVKNVPGSCTPAPTSVPGPFPFQDQVNPTLPAPSAAGVDDSWSSINPTSACPDGTEPPTVWCLAPGVYHNINVAIGTLVLQKGIYIVTGDLTVSGTGSVTSHDPGANADNPVVIYLACPTSGPHWTCASGGGSGGSIVTRDTGSISLHAYADAPYTDIALFADPNLVDPDDGSTLQVAGLGVTLRGTVDVPQGSASMTTGAPGGTGLTIDPPAGHQGRLIVNSLSIAGDSTARLVLTGKVEPTCSYYTDQVTGSDGGHSVTAWVAFASNCDSGQTARIVSFSYNRTA